MKKLKIAPWPRFGQTNPRLSYLHDTLDREFHLIDVKSRKLGGLSASIIHLHWPESVLKGKMWLAKLVLLAGYLFVARSLQVKLVLTIHNDPKVFFAEHRIKLWLYTSMVLKQIDHFILPGTKIPKFFQKIRNPKFSFLPLGFIPIKIENEGAVVEEYQYGLLGRITANKNIAKQILRINEFHLRKYGVLPKILVSGLPIDTSEVTRIKKLITQQGLEKNVDLNFEYLDEKSFQTQMLRCDTIVTFYDKMTNSGIVTLALSLNKKILTNNIDLLRDVRLVYGGAITYYDGEEVIKELCLPLNRSLFIKDGSKLTRRYKKIINRILQSE